MMKTKKKQNKKALEVNPEDLQENERTLNIWNQV
jgi:hypothetical protein